MEKKTLKGYKVMNPDMTCKGFQYQVGEIYKHKGKIEHCGSGFHFCKKLKDCYNYYTFDYKNIVCEVEGSGRVITEGNKTVCSEIKIVRRLELNEVLEKLNLFCNNNKGSNNQGSENQGSGNKGSWNQGSGNFGSYTVGVFNYTSFVGSVKNCACFNKETGMSIIQFYRKYLDVLKEVRSYNFTNVSKLPGYTQKKWDIIKKHI